MKKLVFSLFLLVSNYSLAESCVKPAEDPLLCETREIIFESGEAIELTSKAGALGNPASIYEYVRNNTSYQPYHGARSSTLNSYLAMAGNDVDLASLLIALYRSVGVKARYATGNIKLSKHDVANWLSITNESLAVSILADQGINIVSEDADSVVFEHVWVEALVNLVVYRGGDTDTTCREDNGSCNWVNLDPSFKLRSYSPGYRDVLAGLDFDYDAYYRAESDPALRGKGPLEVYEEAALEYLRLNHPDITLEDVMDEGVVVSETAGILPLSLPYQVLGPIKSYESIEAHDSASDSGFMWNKKTVVKITPMIQGVCPLDIGPGSEFSAADLSTKRLTVNWDSLGDEQGVLRMRLDGGSEGFAMYSAGVMSCTDGQGNTYREALTDETRFNVSISVDVSPVRAPVTVEYKDLIAGGYHLIATGGESSNDSQLHRAYRQLLDGYDDKALLKDESGDIYVDSNGNGLIDTDEVLFSSDTQAQDVLTGGLLYAAQTLYFSRLRKEAHRYERLKNIVSPISAYVGVISTFYEVDLVDGTPFSILPGGLLIDLKGITINGVWESDKAETFSNDAFKFMGHIVSSLEHEVWQELTGYDAISTIRGIQLALKDGADLEYLNLEVASVDELLASYGVKATPPQEFQRVSYEIFDREFVAWNYTGSAASEAGFYFMRKDLSSYGREDNRASVYSYLPSNNISDFLKSYDDTENHYDDILAWESGKNVFPATGELPEGFPILGVELRGGNAGKFTFEGVNRSGDQFTAYLKETTNLAFGDYPITLRISTNVAGRGLTTDINLVVKIEQTKTNLNCNGVDHSNIFIAQALSVLESCFTQSASSVSGLLDMLDSTKNFSDENMMYFDGQHEVDEHGIGFIQKIRNSVYYPENNLSYRMTAPSKLPVGESFAFEVYLVEGQNADGNTVSATYAIANESHRLQAGGAYVVGDQLWSPYEFYNNTIEDLGWSDFDAESLDRLLLEAEAFSISLDTYNPVTFTDFNLVGLTNNDWRTPSTWDPVSTVTGNMYHDETDLKIPGKGLSYIFTRTYNSNPTTSSGEGSQNTNHYPLSQGWTHSYNMKLVANDYGDNPNADAEYVSENADGIVSSITYVNERGGESNYALDGADSSAQPELPYAGFDPLVLDAAGPGLHTITFANGNRYIFDSQGADMRIPGAVARLYRIEDVRGNQLNFTYTNNQLVTITDNQNVAGRTGLALSYYDSGDDVGRLAAVADWTGRQWAYNYASGQLSSVTNPMSFGMSYTYHGDTHLLKDIVHPQDRDGTQKAMRFSYYENGQAYDYVDQLGAVESLTYDLFRHRTRITNARGFTTEHYYDANGALIKLVNPGAGIQLFENNEDGLRYVKYNPLGQRTRYSYNTDQTLEGGASDTQGQVTREEDALGNTIDYTYGIHNQITAVKDKNDNTQSSVYYTANNSSAGAVIGKLHKTIAGGITLVDANGTPVTHTDVTLAEYHYHPDGSLKKQIEYLDPADSSRQRITEIVYDYNPDGATDGSFRLTKTISAAGITVAIVESYDGLWRKTSSTVERETSATDSTLITLSTEYQYDDLGRLVRSIDPADNISETVYDQNGKIYQSIVRYKLLATGNSPKHSQCYVDTDYPAHHSCIVATNHYDAADRLLSSTDIMGAQTHYQYDEMGNVLQVTNELNNSLYFEYDAKGRRTKATDEKGYAVKTTYDLAGRILKVTDANGKSVSYTYDALGRTLTTTSPEGRQTIIDEYDNNGNILRLRDANAIAGKQPLNSKGASIFSQFDEFNRQVSTLNANEELTQYRYDLQGNRTHVIDAEGQVTRFVYDDLGRLTQVIDPILEAPTDKRVDITYDRLGNRLTYTDRLGEVTHYHYDTLNRLVKEEYLTDAITAEKTFDQYGDMVSTRYGASTYSYTFDAAHRLLSKLDNRSNRSMSWQYDVIGNLITKTTYEGAVHHFVYDSSNRLVSMAAATGENKPAYLQASYHYDPAGRLLSRILSSGAATLYNYSVDGLLTSLKQLGADGRVVDERSYSHDELGNITQLIVNGSESINYAYDPAYRLLGADSSVNTHDVAYSYDRVGNRKTKIANGALQHYIYSNGNRLDEVRQTAVDGALVYRFDYDANGSMTAKYDGADQQLLHVAYDQRRLATVMGPTPQATGTRFSYDANAYRIGKESSAATKNYYLEGEHLESVYDANNELQANYLRGAVVDEIINGFERNVGGELQNRSFHHDQVNSLVAQTDHNGNSVQHLSYGPFGELLSEAGAGNNSMRYTGREMDSETGLYYYRARYYDSELGRFISEDPIGFEGGGNFYEYVGNQPLQYNDPMGLEKQLQLSVSLAVFLGQSERNAFTTIAFDSKAPGCNGSGGYCASYSNVEARDAWGGGGSGGSAIGISLGDSFWDTQVYYEGRASNLEEGDGLFIGVGVGLDGSSSKGPLPTMSYSESLRREMNAGALYSGGASWERDDSGEISSLGLSGGKVGAGIGFMNSTGHTTAARLASRTFGQIRDDLVTTASGWFGMNENRQNNFNYSDLYPSSAGEVINRNIYSNCN